MPGLFKFVYLHGFNISQLSITSIFYLYASNISWLCLAFISYLLALISLSSPYHLFFIYMLSLAFIPLISLQLSSP